MKRLCLLFLLLTAFGLFGTAEWVRALSKPLSNPGLQEYEPISGRGIPGLADFIGWTGRDWLETEQARIRLQIGSQDAAVWNLNRAGFWSDRFSVYDTVDREGGRDSLASMNIVIKFQHDGDHLNNATFNQLFIDNLYAGAVSNEGNPSGVPEPDTMMLLGSGLLALAGIGRRFTRT